VRRGPPGCRPAIRRGRYVPARAMLAGLSQAHCSRSSGGEVTSSPTSPGFPTNL
jgi:hypothetical protein